MYRVVARTCGLFKKKKKKQTALKFKCSSKILNPIITFPQCYSQKYVSLPKKKKRETICRLKT